MTYSKPTLADLGDAVRTIRDVPKTGASIDGAHPTQASFTATPAYDLDE